MKKISIPLTSNLYNGLDIPIPLESNINTLDELFDH
jgi:hypothetical protein